MVEAALKPWERMGWDPEQEQILYRDWGIFFAGRQQLDVAANYYNKSLNLKESDAKALYFRSRCKRNLAQAEGALEDGKAAAAIERIDKPLIYLEICDALYELNQFENFKIDLHDNMRRFFGRKVATFQNRLIVSDENFQDVLGDTLTPFIQKYEKYFAEVLNKIEREQNVDNRPLWKILKEMDKCDVLSILEKEEVLLSPREKAKRHLSSKVFNQTYIDQSWIDVLFLKSLKMNKNLLLPQCKRSTPILQQVINTKYEVVDNFLKMLQARSPLYTEKWRKFPSKVVRDMHRQANLNRIQYQTKRSMVSQMQVIQQLRKEGNIDKLSQYVEEVMGDYVVLKTRRVMPRKFEYIKEVYNILALAHIDRYVLPDDILESQGKARMLRLLKMPSSKYKDIVQFVFGDKSTYQMPDAPDYSLIAYRQFLVRLKKRIIFAKYSIEKSYILHEIARAHLKQSRFDECCSCARKAIQESKNCDCPIWEFLSTMLIVKAHAVVHKIERCKEALDEAFAVAVRMNNLQLCSFIEFCRAINDDEIALKKRNQSVDSMRKNRSRMSISSRNSIFSSKNSTEDNEVAHSSSAGDAAIEADRKITKL